MNLKKRLSEKLNLLMRKRRDCLMYLGLHQGGSFDSLYDMYKVAYGFEANPELCDSLKEKYKNNKRVHIIHAAVTTFNGTVTLNISDNSGVSSSLGHFNKDFPNEIKMISSVEVPAINLYDFCQVQGIGHITDYKSDIQGMDLEVLKTMRPFIEQKRIATITAEVAKDNKPQIYPDLPDNSESGFQDLLKENYALVATGWDKLEDNVYRDVPEGWWEMDCKWMLKSMGILKQ
jgi:FkbM family methyltransferase